MANSSGQQSSLTASQHHHQKTISNASSIAYPFQTSSISANQHPQMHATGVKYRGMNPNNGVI